MKNTYDETLFRKLKRFKIISIIVFCSGLLIAFDDTRNAIFSMLSWLDIYTPKTKMGDLNSTLMDQNRLIDANQHSIQAQELASIYTEINYELSDDSLLSENLINKIVTFCNFQIPYYYQRKGIMISYPLNKEKGQLFYYIAHSKMSTHSKQELFKKGDFRYSDLSYLKLEDVVVESEFENIDLSYSDFSHSDFNKVCFIGVRMTQSRFDSFQFEDCDFISCIFDSCIFLNTQIKSSQLSFSNFFNTNFKDNYFQDVDLKYSRIRECKFENIEIGPSSELHESSINFEGVRLYPNEDLRHVYPEFITEHLGLYVLDTFVQGGFIDNNQNIFWTNAVDFYQFNSKNKSLMEDNAYAEINYPEIGNRIYDISCGIHRNMKWYREKFCPLVNKYSLSALNEGNEKRYSMPLRSEMCDKLKGDPLFPEMIFILHGNIVLLPTKPGQHYSIFRDGTQLEPAIKASELN